ncbi:MAG: M48 family metallopeptidase [Euryarchaeota archaeon]|nr:M48 family metallopeptidase [Euryarchaeota archaeon]
MSSRGFVSPFHSVSVPDPEKKGRMARKIPKTSLPLLSTDLTYVIVPHARRKRFALVLKPGKKLEVRTPLLYTSSDLLTYERYIVSNQDWIRRVDEKYQKRVENSAEPLSEAFPGRDYILYLGTRYPFHIQSHITSHQAWVALEQNHFFVIRTSNADSKELRIALSTWYRNKAEEVLPPLVEKYAAIMNLSVPDLTYNCVKSRWAVCYPSRNQIRFNILILKTPPDCIEYLVVHELSHFYVSDHSKKFWMVVSSYMPDYKIRRKKLTTYRTVL